MGKFRENSDMKSKKILASAFVLACCLSAYANASWAVNGPISVGSRVHTLSTDNFACDDAQSSATLLDVKKGFQQLSEYNQLAVARTGACVGSDPAVSYEVKEITEISISGRIYRVAKLRFIPKTQYDMPFTTYIPVEQIRIAR